MGFFDNVTSVVNRGAAATERTARTAKLKMQLNELTKQRQGLAAQLGASLYEATRSQPSLRQGREALYDGIAALDEQRFAIQVQVEQLEAEAALQAEAALVLKCPKCGSSVSGTDLFCAGCGMPTAEMRAPAPVPTMPPAATGRVCRQCGAPIGEGNLFCMSCGARVEEGVSDDAPADGAGAMGGGVE